MLIKADTVQKNIKLEIFDDNLAIYENQMELLPDKWEIEHILPKKWQESYFPNSPEEVNNTIEHLGNKVPFEKRLNIVASNGYFTKKKESYKKSNISIVQELSQTHLTDWKLEQIRERDIRISDRIINNFDNWISNPVNSENAELTEEELKAIELIKAKGLENYL